MENLEQKAVDLLNKIESLVSQQSQPAWDTIVQLAKVSAIGDLAITIGLFVLAVSFGMMGRYVLKTFNKKAAAYEEWRNESYDEKARLEQPEDPDENFYCPLMFIAWIISGVFAVFATSKLFQVWMWVALVNPELAVARQIVEKLLR